MDFFERQDKARRNTKWLVIYFVAGVTMLICVLYLAALVLFAGASAHRRVGYGYRAQEASTLWNPGLFGGVALGTLAVVGIGSLVKTLELSQGGSAVATLLGGVPVNPNTADADQRKLLNVVEEMALASGVPVPQVYLLPQEQAINAFAAGHTTSDAAVGVTAGAVKLLDRDELQGVIAHEFSHILNGDMRLNLRLIGWVFGIFCIAVIGRVLLQARSSSSRDKNPLPLIGLVLLVIGWVGVFFGRLIQAAVSRQRECLADASAVQFTRNPSGLAGALKKIGGLAYGSQLKAAHAAEASHMFFGDCLKSNFLGLWATHPPLEQRIRALEPDFNGEYPAVRAPAAEPMVDRGARPVRRGPLILPVPGRLAGVSAAAGALAVPPVISARGAFANAGNPDVTHLDYADHLRENIPARLRESARESLGANVLVYGMLLSADETTRQKQLEELQRAAGQAAAQETLRLYPEIQQVAAHARLPLVDLALPALRQMSRGQFQQFQLAVRALVEADGEIDLFEYMLQKILLRHLEPCFVGARKPVVQYYSLKPLAGDCAVLVSAVARVGQQEPGKIQAAFAQGADRLGFAAQAELELLPAEQCDLGKVDEALDRLALAVPQIKKNVLNACALAVAADGLVQEMEAEMLRAIADALDCPIPPFIPQSAAPAPAVAA